MTYRKFALLSLAIHPHQSLIDELTHSAAAFVFLNSNLWFILLSRYIVHCIQYLPQVMLNLSKKCVLLESEN